MYGATPRDRSRPEHAADDRRRRLERWVLAYYHRNLLLIGEAGDRGALEEAVALSRGDLAIAKEAMFDELRAVDLAIDVPGPNTFTLPALVAEVANAYDMAAMLLRNLYEALFEPQKKRPDFPRNPASCRVYCGLPEDTEQTGELARGPEALVGNAFFVIGLDAVEENLVFKDRATLPELACRRPADLRSVYDRVVSGTDR